MTDQDADNFPDSYSVSPSDTTTWVYLLTVATPLLSIAMATPTENCLQYPGITYARILDEGTLDDVLRETSETSPLAPRKAPHRGLPVADCGVLESLPVEVIQTVAFQLDLRSLTSMRLVNRRLTDIIDRLPQYDLVMTYAREAMRAYHAIEFASHVTLAQLHGQMFTSECAVCGSFGGFLFLLTCERVCFMCVLEHPRYLPLEPEEARRRFGLDEQALAALPHMKTVPGTYWMYTMTEVGRIELVPHDAALQAGIDMYGSREAMGAHVKRDAAADDEAVTETVSEEDDLIKSLQQSHLRAVALFQVPRVDERSRKTEWGFHCEACYEMDQLYGLARFRALRQLFDVQTIKLHVDKDVSEEGGHGWAKRYMVKRDAC